jgi:N-acetylglucosaminyl-diphospho-decaprenol L-rhamnosyltransferase
MKPSLDIILVNRNSGKLIQRCLQSIATSSRTVFTLSCVCVVDDNSTDDSLDGLEDISIPLKIIRNEERIGYGASCNRGAAATSGDLILFLNTDIELNIDSMNVAVERYPALHEASIGIVGIQLFELDGSIARCTSRFPSAGNLIREALYLNKLFPGVFKSTMQSDWNHKDSRQVDQVMGAFMLISRSIFEESGGYSKHFFVYMEDLDLSLRIKQLGYSSYYLTDTSALHLGGGTARKFWWESLFFSQRSRIQYVFLHFGALYGIIMALISLLISPFIRIIYHLAKRDFSDVKATVKATLHLWGWAMKKIIGAK